MIKVQNLLLHEVLHMHLISTHCHLRVIILHWSLLLAPCLILNWLRLTHIVLLVWLWLSRKADVTVVSETKVIVVASLASPTFTLSILLRSFLIFGVSIIWRSGPFISKSSLVIVTASIIRRVQFFKIFLARD